MKNIIKIFFLSVLTIFTSCSNSDDTFVDAIELPDSYVFERNGETSVSFSNQTKSIAMAEEIIVGLIDVDFTEERISNMFVHIGGTQDFADNESLGLNDSDENVRNNVASSFDYFNFETVASEAIKEDFDGWITEQVTEVFPNWANVQADSQTAGYIGSENSIIYVNANGVALNELFSKGLIGALITDQILNNCLSVNVLDANDNITDNDNGTLEEGKNYTAIEHKWDEAYGYLYAAETDTKTPVLGADSFLNQYLSNVDSDTDFFGIADDVYNAFKLGRAAIVAKDYTVRDEQIEIIRENISTVIGVSVVKQLQEGKTALEVDNPDLGVAFNAVSKGLGFLYSLQFTRNLTNNEPYFTKTEVEDYFSDLLDQDGGLWNANTVNVLDVISTEIANEFDFSLDEVID